ncbi:DEAD/DEAH box helicase [Vibrio metschnikovii]|uniref:DEAD/DEAH box helicase n=1 Tax=bacterium 19MO03SA05 TaxID=2920620 RepID=A0AAU6VG03_UNCXX|nr:MULTISPECIES: DEAD/DEAH box helicase [Vibrio]EKO3573516.1 DEAD/DEAH box helicase [Vibrio metschnikovii]EKO3594054.1 DEAD/DEAH box helicase [Vibrio metschnikovii]EKO3618677.1 DEAD/DEAH box helicase [Vibrio metschnikovii]EKO3629213.1 DEAD/DEAH box helicase [Vibrio metschnikovii]EKO3656083.1 DEAD/DEAH box helicase [Vibrio metschnikovii]
MTFSELNLASSLLSALPAELHTPTTIQQLAIPVILSGRDLLALAQTGSGKTFAYGLPLLQKTLPMTPHIQTLIIVPTRELATQVSQALGLIAKPMNIDVCPLCGGVDQQWQQDQLAQNPQLIVATPGRLLDLIEQQIINLSSLQHLVLDEADRLLEMGFWPDVQRIMAHLPAKKQTLLFSATLLPELEEKALQPLNDPIKISANLPNQTVPEIDEQLYLVNKGSKAQVLIHLLKQHHWSQVLVFISARDNADALAKKLLKAGIRVAALHGNKDQTEREQILTQFKQQKIEVLIATDLLARGIHIEQLPVVINFDLPPSPAVYIHRVGRTARAGQTGLALSLVCHNENAILDAIRQLTQRPLVLQTLADFPVTDQPATTVPKRQPRDKQANRRSAQKRSVKQFQPKSSR